LIDDKIIDKIGGTGGREGRREEGSLGDKNDFIFLVMM